MTEFKAVEHDTWCDRNCDCDGYNEAGAAYRKGHKPVPLYTNPFTREDVEELRECSKLLAGEFGSGGTDPKLDSIADRIEALLPPEPVAKTVLEPGEFIEVPLSTTLED